MPDHRFSEATPPPKYPASRIAVHLVLLAAVAMAIAVGCLGEQSALHVLSHLRQRATAQQWRAMDELLREAGAQSDTVVVFPTGASNVGKVDVPAAVYYRGCYLLYPRRIFAAPDGKVMNQNADFNEFVAIHAIHQAINIDMKEGGHPAAFHPPPSVDPTQPPIRSFSSRHARRGRRMTCAIA